MDNRVKKDMQYFGAAMVAVVVLGPFVAHFLLLYFWWVERLLGGK